MKKLIFLVLLLAGCTSTAGPISDSPTPPPPTISASTMPKVSPTQSIMPISGITMVHDPGHVTGHINGPCYMLGDSPTTYRPDPTCTPGSVDPSITKDMLCSPSYRTSSYRPPASETDAAKWNIVEPAYQEHVTGELDHLISLELGGSNDLSNLWVEPGSIPNPKDKIENELHADVCSGKITLAEAQAEIANDWTKVNA